MLSCLYATDVQEGTFEGTVKIFNDDIFPKLGSDQHVLYVPPAYGCGGSEPNIGLCTQVCCNSATRDGPNPPCHGNCTQAMLLWARQTYDWARATPQVIGLNPWHWNGAIPKVSTRFEPGLRFMPAVRAVWKQIGQEIVSGRLGDIHMGLLQTTL